MSEEIKKDVQDEELKLDELAEVAGGTNLNTVDWGDLSKLPYTCPICNVIFNKKEEVVGHLMAHVAETYQTKL